MMQFSYCSSDDIVFTPAQSGQSVMNVAIARTELYFQIFLMSVFLFLGPSF